MARPIVKYLDPVSGGYEFATVVDIGDLRNLNTTIKSDIVGAINSIISDGVHNPVNDERIENLEAIINSLKDGTFQIDDFGSIDEHLKQKFLEELDKINAQNREEMQSVLTKLDTSVNDAIRGYQEKVAAQNIILENAENTLVDARGTLEAKAAELETAKIGFSELKTEFDELDGYITTNIRTIDFDNFNAMVEDYETIVTQTSVEVGVDMSGSTLSYLTGRVTEAEANISAQADEITSKMSYDEFQYMPVPKYSYGENLLFDTFDFGDAWSGKNGAQVTPDTFLFGKVVAFNSPTGLYETRTDDLTIGESYVLSTYVNVQPSEKSPSQDKYEPISTSYDPTDFKIQIGGASFNPGIYEDLSGVNGWVRINQEFVADAVNPIISITPVGVNSQSEVAYMAMPKVEKGLTVTPWQPHVEDNYATISSTQSMIKQQANSITAFVTEVSELDDSYKQATSTFKMLADGFEANTEAVKNYEDAVIRYGTEYSNINGKFEQKVWKDDFKTAIEDINIDNRNRVLNSDFIRSEISSSDRRLIVEDWSLNSDWEIKTIDNDKYLSRNRTGLTQNLITSASSDYFPVRNGERILFGFDLIHSGLDNDKVFAIELFDISDKRLLKQEFSLSSLTKVGNRYHGSFSISTPGAEKGSVVLQLPKNGSVSFTKISFQNADIGSVDWSPAPEDSWIIQSKLETYISQVEDEITIGGTGQKLDTLTGLLTEDKGTFTLNPDKIATEVLNSQTYDDMGFVNKTNFEQTADGWMQEITSEGRLAGYINASPDTYRISFDKIMLEGTTWADALGSSKIMVTENFALMGQNGKPVLDVKNDGSINMNITSLKIGEYNALTTNDKSDIESEVADKVINTTKPYVHIAYADTEDGQGLSFNPSGKQYIGFAKSHLPTPSGTASNYEWSKYVGSDGYEGADGVGIKSTTIRYASSTSGTSQPSTGWSSTIPTVEPGNYLWTEIVWTYTNSEKKQSYTVARIGADGADGKDGVVGKDGVGIKSTTITYGVSPNETTQPATYTSTVPTLVKGQYLWTKTVWVYTDSTTETGYTKTYIPKDGNDGTNGIAGKDGVGISKTTITYAKSTNGTTAPTTGYTTTVPSANPGEFVWTKTVWTYTDNTTETGYSVGKIGNTGATGANGKDGVAGKDGVGIQKTDIHYASSASGTTKPSTGWNLTVPTISPGNYLWTKTTWTYTDGTIEEGYSVSRIGKDGNTGKDGVAGKDGVGIKSTVISYATSSSGTTKPTSGWASTVPSVTPGNYLWTRTTWTYTDNDIEEGYSVSHIGKDGINGTNGKDGTGIKSAVIAYTIHSNGTTTPTSGWVSTVPSPEKGKYMWTRTITTYTDNTKSTTYSVAYQATDGQEGPKGADGSNGTGISSTAVTYAQTTSGTTTPTSWSSTRPAPIKGQYLWSRTIITYTNGTSSTAYNTSYSATDGQKGDKGDIGPQGPQGLQGPAGSNGQSQWVHIRYSVNSNGSGMTTSPSSTTKYVGIAVTNSATAPAFPEFTWSKYVGEDGSRGPQGLPGKNGDDGTTTYTWIRYADTPTSGMNQYPDGKKYIGLAFNKTTPTESNNYSDYQWSLMPQNIEVGGRNLLKGTSNEWTQLVRPEGNYFWEQGTDLQLEAGETYTFSVIVEKVSDDSVPINLHIGLGMYPYTYTHDIVTWRKNNIPFGQKIVITQKIDAGHTGDGARTYFSWRLRNERLATTIRFKEAKLEKGNVATDWTEAPEDTQSQIDGIESGIGDLYLADKTGVLSGEEIYTDKADDDGVVHVEVDGKSYQHAGSGKNLFIPPRVIDGTMASQQIDNRDTLSPSGENEKFYEISGEPNKQYTFTFNYKHTQGQEPNYVKFFYSDGTDDGKSQGALDKTTWTTKSITSKPNKTVVGIGYHNSETEWRVGTLEESIPFSRTVINDSTKLASESYIRKNGVNGKRIYSIEYKWVNGVKTSESRNKKLTSTINPVNEEYVQGTMNVVWKAETYNESIKFSRTTIDDKNVLPANSYIRKPGVNGSHTYSIEYKWVNNVKTSETRNKKLVSTKNPVNEEYVRGTMVVEWKQETSTETIAFTRTTQDNSNIYPNESYVSRAGVNGSITYNLERKWVNGASTNETRNKVEASRENAVNEIYIRGTKSSEWRKVTTYETIPYTTIRQNDNTIEIGTEIVGTAGKNGRIKVITEHEYINNSPTGEKREVSRVTDIDMVPKVIKVGTKPKELVNLLEPSKIKLPNALDIQINGVRKPVQSVDRLDIPLELMQWAANPALNIEGDAIQTGKEYTLAFKYEIKEGTVDNIRSTANLPWWNNKTYMDGELVSTRADAEVPDALWPKTPGVHTFVYQFGPSKESASKIFMFRFNENHYTSPVKIWLTDIGLYEGHVQPFGKAEIPEKVDLIPFKLDPDVTPSTTKTTIDAFANKKTYNLVTDFGAIGDGETDNFAAMKQAILSSVSEPVNIVVPKGNFYYRGPDNARLEVWPNKSKGIRFIGQDGSVLLPDHNRTQTVHESYVMQLEFEDTSIGFAMEGLTIDGINAPQDIYHTMPNPTNVTVPTLRGISITAAQEIVVHNSTFKNIFGGYTIIASKYKQVDLSHIELDRCGGNAWTESFGGALYFSGHYGDATINIDNVHAEGYTDSRYPKLLGWIGIIFENGSVQLDNQSSWIKDVNTYFNITNSSFLNYETGWHVETVAGNTYWNSNNVLYKVNNYAIVAALWGEIKEASNRIKTQLLPFGRTGIIKGMYYSEKEASKNENGLNDFKMYNSYIDVIDVPGFPSILQVMSYGDSVHGKYYNTTFNNIPNGLVTNGSTTVVNSEINLAPNNSKTDYQLQNGQFSKPVHKVNLTNTNINRGVAKIATKGSNPAKVKNTGYTPPPLTQPLGPATLEREG